jgi:hypothetical protein
MTLKAECTLTQMDFFQIVIGQVLADRHGVLHVITGMQYAIPSVDTTTNNIVHSISIEGSKFNISSYQDIHGDSSFDDYLVLNTTIPGENLNNYKFLLQQLHESK